MTTDLRPLSVGELLDRSFTLYRRQFATFVTIAAIPALVVFAAQLGFGKFVASSANAGSAPEFSSFLVPTVLIGALILSIVFLFVSAASHGALVHAASAVRMDQPTSISQAFASMKGNIARTAGVIFVTYLLASLGFLLLIVPGILLTLRWALVIPCTVLEETGVSDSRSRSTFLTDGCRGRIFLIFLLYFLVMYALIGFVQFPIMALLMVAALKAGSTNPTLPFWYLAAEWGSAFVVSALVTPILLIALTLQYYDGRIRKEALDLQVLMQSAAATSGA